MILNSNNADMVTGDWTQHAASPQPFSATLHFAYASPPLHANQRLHWAQKKNLTKRVRAETAIKARDAQIPALGTCTVTLTWHVNTTHRRDADNIVPTLKAMCDGLVDAGVVEDDTPNFMHKIMPIIAYEKGCVARMELRIETNQ